MGDTIPVLLDTDIGTDIDDALCLAYLLAEPRCELVGVTTATGEPQRRAGLAKMICEAAGRDDVPVVSGAEFPIMVEQNQTRASQAEVLDDHDIGTDFAPDRAVGFLREKTRERPGEVVLLTIGPLTNIGLLFALDREVPSMLRSLVMMAGIFFPPERLETNAKIDPHASSIVFSADPPDARVYGLDVTLQCQMPPDEAREKMRGGTLDVVAEMAEVYFRHSDIVTFHDPLAAAALFEPDMCEYERGRVSIDLEGEVGLTKFRPDEDGPHRVASAVDPERFFDRYFSVVAPS
jgi:purine nucleosidase